jgi:phage terminase large subunit GpA-like protein
MIGYSKLYATIITGLIPDLDLLVDEWSDQFMVIPKSSGSNEYGAYKTARTPHAREVMRCLSDSHSCKRVVCMVSSQMFKTQVALNWFGATVHQSPSNFLWLMPTGQLQKRIAGRIDKTIAAVPVLRDRVAKPNSRDAKNNLDIKEYIGGSLFIATAGSAANLSELPARRVAIDEVDRCEENVDGEGDPIKLAESRQTTFAHNKKSYYYSSPTIEGSSRIAELYESGTKRRALAECVHCGHAQELIFENLIMTDDGVAMYPCCECGGMHRESDKQKMFVKGLWSIQVNGTANETESFTANSMYLPYGWLAWADLMSEYDAAKQKLDQGNDAMMIVFYNTRLARVWQRKVQVITPETLRDRAEPYRLRTAPHGVLMITAGVDTQDNRLAVQIVGWGRDLEAWPIDYLELHGDPINAEVWDSLTELLNTKIQHAGGHELGIRATAIDIGGHRTNAVKNYVRMKRIRQAIAVYGSIKVGAEVLGKGVAKDIKWGGKVDKNGVIIHPVGTIGIKNTIFANISNDALKDPEDRMIHFSDQFEDSYFAGIVSETLDRKTGRYEKLNDWVRNEPLDTMVYAYAALHHENVRAHLYTEKQWDNLVINASQPMTTPGKISLTNWARK